MLDAKKSHHGHERRCFSHRNFGIRFRVKSLFFYEVKTSAVGSEKALDNFEMLIWREHEIPNTTITGDGNSCLVSFLAAVHNSFQAFSFRFSTGHFASMVQAQTLKEPLIWRPVTIQCYRGRNPRLL